MSFSITVPAEPGSVRRVREALLAWLLTAGWPDDQHDPLVFAVSESVSNAVEHAYPGGGRGDQVTVRVHEQTRDGRRQVIASVVDGGTWRPVDDGSPDEGRHRGIMLMRAFTESVAIERSARGTTVTITSSPVGAVSAAPGA